MIYIINYGAGNIGSITNALEYLGYEYTITENPDMIKEADKLILPGVGAFGEIMDNLKKQKLIESSRKALLQRLARIHPGWEQRTKEEQISLLAEQTEMKAETIKQLLYSDANNPSFEQAETFTQLIKDLENIRNNL